MVRACLQVGGAPRCTCCPLAARTAARGYRQPEPAAALLAGVAAPVPAARATGPAACAPDLRNEQVSLRISAWARTWATMLGSRHSLCRQEKQPTFRRDCDREAEAEAGAGAVSAVRRAPSGAPQRPLRLAEPLCRIRWCRGDGSASVSTARLAGTETETETETVRLAGTRRDGEWSSGVNGGSSGRSATQVARASAKLLLRARV